MKLNKPNKIIRLKAFLGFYVLIISCMFSSCEKDPLKDCRKDPTCEYFVCKVDGKRWEPHCNSEPLFGCTPWDVQYYRKNSGNLGMYIKNENNKQAFTLLTRKHHLQLNENKLYKDEFIQTFFADGNYLTNCKIFVIDTLGNSSLNISRIDTINYYLSGTFYFTGKNDCGDEVKITDGEFNLAYRF